jgi:hypothetical protein
VSNFADRMTAPRLSEPFAVVQDHNQWLAAIRRHIQELDLSFETVCDGSGIQSNYLTKILSDPPPKRASPFTMFLIAQFLGLSTQLVESPQLVEMYSKRWTKRKARRPVPTAVSMNRVIELPPDFMRRISKMGCEARMRKLSPERRSEIGRAAASARWQRHREREAAP